MFQATRRPDGTRGQVGGNRGHALGVAGGQRAEGRATEHRGRGRRMGRLGTTGLR